MKKFFAMLMALLLAFSLVACSSDTPVKEESKAPSTSIP